MSEQDMREKVIKGLECCSRTTAEPNCEECPYNANKMSCDNDMMQDALALLKAQEPVKPIRLEGKRGWFFYCPNCKTILNDMAKPKYCSECGQAVKWE